MKVEGVNLTSDIFTDLLTSPCLKGIVNSLTENKDRKLKILRLFKDYFYENGEDVNLIFEDGDFDTYGRRVSSTNGSRVILNRITLNAASKEFSTSIILHEIIHSIFNRSATDPTLWSSMSAQHDEIFYKWVNDITAVLESIYGIDHNDAVALGLGGLYDEFVIKEGDLNALNVFAEFYYGINLTLAKEIRQEYENGTKGTGCN